MILKIEAACGCNKGKVRSNNEDNFYFDGKCLREENNGLRHAAYMQDVLKPGFCVAVFDGMGGENYGESAAYIAAETLRNTERNLSQFLIPEKQYLNELCMKINEEVVKAAKERRTNRMGTTMVALYFSLRFVYVCNLGDSRAYRLRSNELMQISEDHVEKIQLFDRMGAPRKAPLTQHLGIDPEDVLIEPYIAKGEVKRGDQYLLCSDGLTDMVSNLEIYNVLNSYEEVDECVDALIQLALDKGGKDNITVILCRVK